MFFLLVLVSILTIFYIYCFCRTIFKFVKNISIEPKEKELYNKYKLMKFVSLFIYIILLIVSILLSMNNIFKKWILIYYVLWFIGLFLMKLNLNLIYHYLNVFFYKDKLEIIEKDYLFGGVTKENDEYYLFYRYPKLKNKI